MAPQILFFTGAPLSSSIDWTSPHTKNSLLNSFDPVFDRFLGLDDEKSRIEGQSSRQPAPTPTPTDSKHAAWRSLQLTRQHLPTGYSQLRSWMGSVDDSSGVEYEDIEGDADFLGATNLTTSFTTASDEGREGADGGATSRFTISQTVHDDDESGICELSTATDPVASIRSQFYEHSFTLHADVPSSQISAYGSQQKRDTQSSSSFSSTSLPPSTTTASLSFLSPSQPPPQPPLLHPNTPLTSLNAIPKPNYLHSIQPQTMTVNLVVGVITASEPRRITMRRGAEVEMVELLVGDASRTGFGVTFWLAGGGVPAMEREVSPPPPPAAKRRKGGTRREGLRSGVGREDGNVEGGQRPDGPNKDHDEVRDVLQTLRPQDIILLTNVALSSFRGKVYGQSLRRGLTKVTLLFRYRIDRFDYGGVYTAKQMEGERDQSGENGEDVLLQRTRDVRGWVARFVGRPVGVWREEEEKGEDDGAGAGAGASGGGGGGLERRARRASRRSKERRVQVPREVLPPDTQ